MKLLCTECSNQNDANDAILYCATEKINLCVACSEQHIDHRLARLELCVHCQERHATHNCSICKRRHCTECQPIHHPKGTKEHAVRALPLPRKPTVPFAKMFAADARIISTRKEVKIGNAQVEDMARIKSKVKKMLAIAGNAGNQSEAKQASHIAATWMAKYQLSQFDVATSGQLEEGDYMVQIRDPKQQVGTDKEWIMKLCNKVAQLFPCFVKSYHRGSYYGAVDTYCYLGVEDSAWNACELFCELFGIVAHHHALAKYTRRFVTAVSLDSYAYGMVQGMPLKEFVDAPELLRDFSEGDRNKMLIIRQAGNAVVEKAWNRHSWGKDVANKFKRKDYSAMQAGRQDGARVSLSDKRVKRIEM